MLSHFDTCGNLPTSPQRIPTLFTPFHHMPDVSLAMVALALYTSVHTLSRFWRCSWIYCWTLGCSSTLSSVRWVFSPFTPISSINVSSVDPTCVFSRFHDCWRIADTKLAASYTYLVGLYMHCVVWNAIYSQLSSSYTLWLYPQWKSIGNDIWSQVQVSGNSLTFGCIPPSSSIG